MVGNDNVCFIQMLSGFGKWALPVCTQARMAGMFVGNDGLPDSVRNGFWPAVPVTIPFPPVVGIIEIVDKINVGLLGFISKQNLLAGSLSIRCTSQFLTAAVALTPLASTKLNSFGTTRRKRGKSFQSTVPVKQQWR